jgi:hypothetical protein
LIECHNDGDDDDDDEKRYVVCVCYYYITVALLLANIVCIDNILYNNIMYMYVVMYVLFVV